MCMPCQGIVTRKTPYASTYPHRRTQRNLAEYILLEWRQFLHIDTSLFLSTNITYVTLYNSSTPASAPKKNMSVAPANALLLLAIA